MLIIAIYRPDEAIVDDFDMRLADTLRATDKSKRPDRFYRH
jgi:hypothetical protein